MSNRMAGLIMLLLFFAMFLCDMDGQDYPGRKPVYEDEPEILWGETETAAEDRGRATQGDGKEQNELNLILLPAEPETDYPLENTAPAWYREDIRLSADLQGVLFDACRENGIDYWLGLALVKAESEFDPAADNGLCYGLCQLNREYHPDGLSPADNLREGMKTLREQMDRYPGDIAAALTAYNAGHDTGNRSYANGVLQQAAEWGYSV